MVIGFLIALLLAWPTFGLSIVAYLVIAAMKGYMKGKMHKQTADEREVNQVLNTGLTGKLPSWVGDHDEVDTFVRVVGQMARHKGIPPIYVREILKNDEFIGLLLNHAGEMEALSNSRASQQMGAVNLIIESYHRLSAENQAKLSLMQLSDNIERNSV